VLAIGRQDLIFSKSSSSNATSTSWARMLLRHRTREASEDLHAPSAVIADIVGLESRARRACIAANALHCGATSIASISRCRPPPRYWRRSSTSSEQVSPSSRSARLEANVQMIETRQRRTSRRNRARMAASAAVGVDDLRATALDFSSAASSPSAGAEAHRRECARCIP
jgi:hypothetical protein